MLIFKAEEKKEEKKSGEKNSPLRRDLHDSKLIAIRTGR